MVKTRNTYAELEIKPLTTDKQSPKGSKNLGERLMVEEVRRMLVPNGLYYHLRGELSIKRDGQKVYYRQQGLETDLSYLQFLLSLLSNLAKGYASVVAFGEKQFRLYKGLPMTEIACCEMSLLEY